MNEKTRRVRTLGLGLGVALTALGLGFGVWWRSTAPQPPAIELGHVDPQVARAIDVARTLTTEEPYSARAWGELGMVLHAHEFYEQARTCYETAERFDASDPRWPYLQALCWQMADAELALSCLRRAAPRATVVAAPKMRLAEALIERDQFDEAETLLHEVLQREPTHAFAEFGLGRIAFARGDLKTSQQHLERAVTRESRALGPHALLARVCEQLGNKDQADDEWRLAAQANATTTWADPFLDALSEREVGQNAVLKRSQRLSSNGDLVNAQALLVKGLPAYPQSAKLHAELGKVRVLLEDLKRAEPELREAVRLDPSMVTATFYLGACLRLQARHNEAAEWLGKTVRIQPQFAVAHFELGLSLDGLGDTPNALQAFREAVRYKPDLAVAHKTLAIVLIRNGKSAEAVPHLERAAALLPEDREIQRLLAETESPAKSKEVLVPK